MKIKWKSFLWEMLGGLLVSIGVYNFAAQAEFPMTGFTGIALIMYRLFELPIGVSNIVLNIPVSILCYRLLGRGFFLRSVRCMMISALMVDYVAPLFPVFTGDRMLAAICTGVISGIGYALIYMQNSSSGGADFVIMAIKAKLPHVALGNITFMFAAGVIGITWLIFGDTEGVIYGLIINYLSGFVINQTMYGLNAGKLTMVVTKKGKVIADTIEKCCQRGSTIINAFGGYKEEPKQMVFCACSNKQMFRLQKVIKEVDPESFMVIWESNEVRGDGFHVFTLEQNEK